MRVLLKDGSVLEQGKWKQTDVAIENGVIVARGEQLSFPAEKVFDCRGFALFPGFVDVHVHLREPGFSYKETIATGSAACAHGGYTTVCAMPNLNPAPDSSEHLAVEEALIQGEAVIDVRPYASITMGQKGEGELTDMAALSGRVCGFSDDGRGVKTAETMREAMQKCKEADSIIAAHCEDMSWIPAGGAIHDGAFAKAHGIPGIPSESEWKPIERDIALCRETGCRYHVCHVSTKESVALIRQAKAEGINITCETGPHYLLLCQDDLQDLGRFKMNPPLRNKDDQEALLAGLLDGTIDMIATDHAPHSAEEKAKPFAEAPSGIIGLETALALGITNLVRKGHLTVMQLIEKMSLNPAKLYKLDKGAIAEGADADLVIFNEGERWHVGPKFVSKAANTPFAGEDLYGKVKYTICAGNVVYEDGE